MGKKSICENVFRLLSGASEDGGLSVVYIVWKNYQNAELLSDGRDTIHRDLFFLRA